MKTRLSLLGGLLLTVAAHSQTTQQYSGSDQLSTRNYGRNESSDSYQSESSGTGTPVTPLNKASNLIGTEVRDNSNQPVGEVKDVVIDFKSGRVAYVVVDAKNVLDGDRTCIAVPARAIRLNPRQNALTIDADPKRIEQLRGFTANNFPAIRSQTAQMTNWRNQNRSGGYQKGQSRSGNSSADSSAWSDSRYSYNPNQNRGDNSDADWYYYEWYLVPNSASQSRSENDADTGTYERQEYQGASGQSQSGRLRQDSSDSSEPSFNGRPSSDSGWTAYNLYKKRERARNSNSNAERRSDQGQEQSASPQGSGQGGQSRASTSSNAQSSNSASSKHLSGWVRSVNPDTRTLTVESQDKTLSFEVADNATIKHNGTQNIDLSELQPGQRVDLAYRYRNGSNRAVTINQHTEGAASTSSSNADHAGSSE